MTDSDDIPQIALDWHRAGRGAALATVVQTWGSAPRRIGAMLAVSGAGDMAGSVSGGCVEGAVVAEAIEAIAEGAARMLEYGVADGDAFAVGLACGGTIRVLVQPVGSALPEAVLAQLTEARTARVPAALVSPKGAPPRVEASGHAERFRMDRSGFEEDGETFVAIHNPPLRLIVVGAVHIAQTLVPMAQAVGYDPVVVDPRSAFASAARFPGTRLLDDWPDDGVRALGLDGRTALVLLTHDPKLDDPALTEALRSKVFYIGALGSTRTHAARLDRMRAAGFGEDDLARIHGPVGLDIGAAGPAEIALSILAQMTQVLRRGA
ncbi:xanthine dehydrogenase accessory factor [Roseovarius nanhaiticus]|uniref:Xanthine dehydrogenase accessory factor n=1 Tax=Roseovarius nanhaiticus TaxID=573024 RepID=A0A1N7GF95_9RHOB|nr:XdhC/CoxI family protein [Roseovarius nanhaiticus]SEK27965.1 xanthine dehydrogenase accessory factor [Roseovarius nanhaiticus]SIS11192.1 xanthine dehydrogenase accessory factor [Roseovarius nanhaiticus]